jgi:translation elongation factor EF-4
MLHMDIFRQRLEEEHGADIIVTSPSVPYRCKLKKGQLIEVENAGDCPAKADI